MSRIRFDRKIPVLLAQLRRTTAELNDDAFRELFFEGCRLADDLDGPGLRDQVRRLEDEVATAWLRQRSRRGDVQVDLGTDRGRKAGLTKWLRSASRRTRMAIAARVPGSDTLLDQLDLDEGRSVGLDRMALCVHAAAEVIAKLPPAYHPFALTPAFAARGKALASAVGDDATPTATPIAAQKQATAAFEPLRTRMRALYRQLLLAHEDAADALADLDPPKVLPAFDLSFLTADAEPDDTED